MAEARDLPQALWSACQRRKVATEDRPHPPVEVATVAHARAGFVLASCALRVPVGSVSDGLPRTTTVGRGTR